MSKPALQYNTSRLDWMDYARGLAIILVVYRHAFEGIKRAGISIADYIGFEYANIMLFSFRMPLFFIISGAFITSSLLKSGLSELLVKKCKLLLYPYFLWGFIQITLQLVMSSYVNAQRNVDDYLLLLYLPRKVEQFWYLYALFNISISYAAIKTWFKLNSTHQLILGIILFAVSIVSANNKVELFFFNDIFHYYIFFAIGDVMAKQIKSPDNAVFFASWRFFWYVLPFFIFTQVYFLITNLNHASDKYQYVEYYQPVQFILISLTGCLFMISVSNLLQKSNSNKWLKEVGFHSLYIYVIHVIVTSCTRILLTRFLDVTNVPILLLIEIILGISVPILIYKLANRLNLYWLFKLDDSKEKSLKVNYSKMKSAVEGA